MNLGRSRLSEQRTRTTVIADGFSMTVCCQDFQEIGALLVDWKIELVGIPVSDVDRAKSFYVEKAGFNADHDHTVNDQLRFVQLTPPGSACSIVLGNGITTAPPGTSQVQIVVANVDDARAELAERGVKVSDVQVLDWGRFVYFEDPDGNKWALQELPVRN